MANLAQSTNILELADFPSVIKNICGDFYEELSVYPVPVKKGKNIYLNDEGTVSIYSLGGNLLINQELAENSILSTANLQAGSYIIQLISPSRTKQSKLIIQ